MPIKHLAPATKTRIAHIVGLLPRKLAAFAWLSLLLLATLLTTACKDSPGYTSEELASDPLPEFDDSAIAGQWLSEGDLINFETKEHGVYVLRAEKEDDEEPLVFTLKRVGSLLFMEYSEQRDGGRFYRPCWIGLDDTVFEFHCLEAGELPDMGVRMETRKTEQSEWEFISDTPERMRQLYVEQAANRKVFEMTLRLTRPQPARIARVRKQAIAGNPEAQERLARYLDAGEIVVRDKDEAEEWACKAADSGRASAEVLCGDFAFQKSKGINPTEVPTLLEDARDKYLNAAEQRYPLAFSRLGKLYETDLMADESAAVASYRRGAELGDSESHAQLGLRHLEGKGVMEDIHLAQEHLELVPESDRSKQVWASLAQIYLHALDPDQRDKKKALYAAEKAVEDSGDPDLNGLAAEAAFENGQYLKAAQYQKDAIYEGQPDQAQRVAKLEMYRSAALIAQ